MRLFRTFEEMVTEVWFILYKYYQVLLYSYFVRGSIYRELSIYTTQYTRILDECVREGNSLGRCGGVFRKGAIECRGHLGATTSK